MEKTPDNEIVKSLEICTGTEGGCRDCPRYNPKKRVDLNCVQELLKDALFLITSQEEVVSCFHRMESLYNIKCMELKVAKAEAIKNFAEIIAKDYPEMEFYLQNLVKEMVGDGE